MKPIKILAFSLIILNVLSCKDNTKELQKIKELENSITDLTEKVISVDVLNTEKRTLDNNKKVVINFYQEFFGNIDFSAADKYIGNVYIQHNPAVADGKEALVSAAKTWLKDAPKSKINFNMILAEKDLVLVQIIDTDKDGNRHSTMDVFRVTNGKISEHWDTFATFKKGDKSANANPLF